MADTPDYRAILLSLIASLALCDNMSDVAGDVQTALRLAGINVEWDDLCDLSSRLRDMGITDLTQLQPEG